MDASPSQSDQPGFPPALQVCLREDAFIRADAGQLRSGLEEARAAADQARQATGLSGRLMAVIGRRKDAPPTPEVAEIFAREKVLQRQAQEMEQILRQHTGELDTLLTGYLQATMPAFLELCQARQQLFPWEAILQDLQADLRNLIRALGQARNTAVAGYDKTTRTISASALELFGQTRGLIANVDDRIRQANEKAAEIGGLPGVVIIPLQETVNSLTKLEIATMQLEFDRLVRELESFEQKQLADLQAPAVAAALARVEQAKAYVAQYREELRAYFDRELKPEETVQAISVILERHRRR